METEDEFSDKNKRFQVLLPEEKDKCIENRQAKIQIEPQSSGLVHLMTI